MVAGITTVMFSAGGHGHKKNATAVKVRSSTVYMRLQTIADKHIVINGAMWSIVVKFIIL